MFLPTCSCFTCIKFLWICNFFRPLGWQFQLLKLESSERTGQWHGCSSLSCQDIGSLYIDQIDAVYYPHYILNDHINSVDVLIEPLVYCLDAWIMWVQIIHLSFITMCIFALTHWGPVTHICVSSLTIIVSDNVILLIAPEGTNFSELFIEMYTFAV